MSILVDRAQAGGSMRPGSIDLMMHRRVTQDDHRGVGEPLLEPGQFGDGLMVRGNHYIVPGLVNDVKHKTLEENILQKPQVFFWDGKYSIFKMSNRLIFIIRRFPRREQTTHQSTRLTFGCQNHCPAEAFRESSRS